MADDEDHDNDDHGHRGSDFVDVGDRLLMLMMLTAANRRHLESILSNGGGVTMNGRNQVIVEEDQNGQRNRQ